MSPILTVCQEDRQIAIRRFAFRKVGATLHDALRLLGVTDIGTPKPAGCLYPTENPFHA